MLIRTFTAENATAALRRVREEMGPDAVVLKSRQTESESGRPLFEITACSDSPATTASSRAIERTTRSRTFQPVRINSKSPVQAVVTAPTHLPAVPDHSNESLRAHLADTDLPTDVIDALSAEIRERKTESATDILPLIRTILTQRIQNLIALDRPVEVGERVLFLGLSGSGKTSALGKLAAHLITKRRTTVCLRSLDDIKVSAHEEIAGYADLLGAQLLLDNDEFAEGSGSAITLIDTPGFPTEPRAHARLMAAIAAIRPTRAYVVVSALHRTADVRAVLSRMTIPAPVELIYTMIDCTVRLGGLLAVADNAERPLTWLAEAPSGIGALVRPNAATLANTILSGERRHA